MSRMRVLGWILAVVAFTWHLSWVARPPDLGRGPVDATLGRDFASYYYGARVAFQGGDPYDVDALSQSARDDGTRKSVHPFFYPPPAVLFVAWAPALDLNSAASLWFWLQELALILCALALALWWRPLGGYTPVAIAVWIALLWGIPYGLAMGQVNPLVLLLMVCGLWMADSDRPWIGGFAIGLAAMIKMSPALLVGWWLLHRRWHAAGAAIATAIGSSLLTLPLVGPQEQLRFYTEVLPAFGSGDYNGLVVKIGMFANHSVPNLLDQLWPGTANQLSAAAQLASTSFAIAVITGLAITFRTRPSDPWQRAAQPAAIATAALLIPVYTYEHHLVQLLPAAVVITAAVATGRLHRGWWAALGLCAVALAWPLPALKELSWRTLSDQPMPAWALQELKFVAIAVLLVGTVWLGRARRPPPRTAPSQTSPERE